MDEKKRIPNRNNAKGNAGAPPPQVSEALNAIVPDFHRWRDFLFTLDCIFTGAVFLLIGLLMIYAAITRLFSSPAGYLLTMLPAMICILIIVLAYCLRKRMSDDDMRQNAIPVFAMTLICITLNVSYCRFFTLVLLFCIPISMTTIFSNKILCRITTVLSILGASVSCIRHYIVDKDWEFWKIPAEYFIAITVLILNSIVAQTLLNMTEGQKQKLLTYAMTSAESSRRAQAASQAKSAFLANMSHEIRTPINAILGMNEMILRESNNEQIKEYSRSIQSASSSLLYLVNDVLDFSKIESGKLDIVETYYDTASFVHDCYNVIAERTQKKGLELKIDCDSQLPSQLYGDEVRIRQVVTNFLTNASKYTEKGSILFKVTSKQEDGQFFLVISVKDTGIGIKEENLQNLFQQFSRFDLEKNRNIEGTGLGLAIADQLVHLMHGEIKVESTYGVGSTFTLIVPQRIINEAPIGDFLKKYRGITQSNIGYQQSFEAPDARILIVDDVEINLKVISNLLKKTKIIIDTAGSGKKCLELAGKNPYDIIFLDHMMPEMSGIETYIQLKQIADSPNQNTPVIMLTANAISGIREQYMQIGFSDYLSKPVHSGKLEEMIIKYLPGDKVHMVAAAAQTQMPVSPGELSELSIPGVDAEAIIRQHGNVESYLELLDMFYTAGIKKTALLEELLKTQNVNDYVIEVHGLKSASANIGAYALSNLAKQHEEAGKRFDTAFIEENFETLISSYRQILQEIKQTLEKKEYGQFAKKETRELLTIEQKDIIQRANQICLLIDDFQSKEAAAALEELLHYQVPDNVASTLESVQLSLKMYEDEQAMEQLKELIKNIQENES